MDKYLTGYPSIDKPWLKYYDRDFLWKPLPEMTLLNYLKLQSRNRKELTALSYFGREISYGELFENIDNASKVFLGLGVKEGDRILFLMPNIPETAYMMYGASQIGAVCDFVDHRPDGAVLSGSPEILSKLAKDEKVKYIVALEQCYVGMISKIQEKLLLMGIDTVILVSETDSMDGRAKVNGLLENLSFGGGKTVKEASA